MSGRRSCVQMRICHAPSFLYIHCHCHRLQLLLMITGKLIKCLVHFWPCGKLHYSPKKPKSWLKFKQFSILQNWKSLNPVTQDGWQGSGVFVPLGNAYLLLFVRYEELWGKWRCWSIWVIEALCTYKFVACLYVLCGILHTVAKLQASLQAKELDSASVPVLVDSTLSRLIELKENPSSTTWFKDHRNVFTDINLLGERNIDISDEQEQFIMHIYRPYIQSVIDCISSGLNSSE